MKPASFCTIVTENMIRDFLVLQKSLQQNHPNLPLITLCDNASLKIIESVDNDQIIPIPNLQQLNYPEIQTRGKAFGRLVGQKPMLVDHCLNLYGNTMFVDADIIFVNPLEITQDNELIFSEHYITQDMEDVHGKYNAGYLFVNNKQFPNWWEEVIAHRSKFFEQEGMIHAEKDFDLGAFAIQHNFGWWRITHGVDPEAVRGKFSASDNIYYDDELLISFHTHVTDDNPAYTEFNGIVKELLANSHATHKELLDYISVLDLAYEQA